VIRHPLRLLACLILTTVCAAETAPAPSPFPPALEAKVVAREAALKAEPPAPGGLLFLGSSSIEIWAKGKVSPMTEDLAPLRFAAAGFGGTRLSQQHLLIERIVLPCRPGHLVLYAGDNDVGDKAADPNPALAAAIHASFVDFVGKVRAVLPEARVSFIAIKPSIRRQAAAGIIAEANRLIREEAARGRGLAFIDIHTPMLGADGKPRAELLGPDGLHLSSAGYKVWAEVIKRELAPR